MRRTRKAAAIAGLAALTAMAGGNANAANLFVNCGAGQTVQAAVNLAAPFDVVIVIGTCTENVAVWKDNVTIFSSAALAGRIDGVGGQPTVRIRANNVQFQGLTITAPAGSGETAVLIHRGGSGTISGNTIRGDASGVNVTQNSYGRIENNPSIIGANNVGVFVGQGSAADILGNVIENSASDGILLSRIGTADVSGNTIRGNGRNGIGVFRGSHLELDDNIFGGIANTIQNNGAFGINCGSNSSIGTDAAIQVFGGNGSGPSQISGSCVVADSIGDPNL